MQITREKIQAAMQCLGMDNKELADYIGVSEHTVNSWLLPVTSKASRPISRPAWKLIMLKLQEEQKEDKWTTLTTQPSAKK